MIGKLLLKSIIIVGNKGEFKMSKILKQCLFILTVLLLITLSGCGAKKNTNYKKQVGYKEYISDTSTGYKDAPYYECNEAMNKSLKAIEFYKNNNRRCGDYIITDYENGVCINKYLGFKSSEDQVIEIPETLEDKPVVKIGSYPVNENVNDTLDIELIGAFAGCMDFTLKIPSTVKYIGDRAFLYYSGIIQEDKRDNYTFVKNIQVDEDNKYYSSKDGVLYTKDMKSLLFDAKLGWYYCTVNSYSVPDFVENFEPSNGIAENLGSIVFEKSIKKINTFIDKGENGIEPDPEYKLNVVVKGYKNTAAEKWAEKQYAKFKAIY